MLPERDQFESLLESVADGADVDWAALDAAAATNAERKRYRNLRLVARVAELHRTLVLEEEDRVLTSLDADAASAPCARPAPKSIRTMRPPFSRMTFCALTSPCTSPCRWTAARA